MNPKEPTYLFPDKKSLKKNKEERLTYEIISERIVRKTERIVYPSDAMKLLKRYGRMKQEYFTVITLNAAHEPIRVSIVSIGLVNKAIVHPREVFSRAIADRAVAIILCHNHPSGGILPSDDDKETNERMCMAGIIIGIPVLDHLIISREEYYSFARNGLIDETTNKYLLNQNEEKENA
jgi:DNA repair protein RadC